jgi:hypothetical protein
LADSSRQKRSSSAFHKPRAMRDRDPISMEVDHAQNSLFSRDFYREIGFHFRGSCSSKTSDPSLAATAKFRLLIFPADEG